MRYHTMKRIGITGGIGCGKSTVLREFEKLGVPCFVADLVAARYYDDPDFLAQLRQQLGEEVFLPDGRADKQAIARKVFATSEMLHRLNALIHPRVLEDFELFCSVHSEADYVLFESAILFDYGFDRLMDAVICVYLGLEERVQRLALRDGFSRDEVMARVKNQMAAEEMMDRANYVILNYEGNPRWRQVCHVDTLIRNGLKSTPSPYLDSGR